MVSGSGSKEDSVDILVVVGLLTAPLPCCRASIQGAISQPSWCWLVLEWWWSLCWLLATGCCKQHSCAGTLMRCAVSLSATAATSALVLSVCQNRCAGLSKPVATKSSTQSASEPTAVMKCQSGYSILLSALCVVSVARVQFPASKSLQRRKIQRWAGGVQMQEAARNSRQQMPCT